MSVNLKELTGLWWWTNTGQEQHAQKKTNRAIEGEGASSDERSNEDPWLLFCFSVFAFTPR